MKFYDIELIDINESVENFSFDRVSEKDIKKIISCFKERELFLEFNSGHAVVMLERKYFRGLMQVPHQEKRKTAYQETIESATEVLNKEKLKVKISKPKVFKEDT